MTIQEPDVFAFQTCTECGRTVGGPTHIDGYAHLINCFRLEDIGVYQLRRQYSSDQTERGRRIMEMVSAFFASPGAFSREEGGS